MAHFYGWDSTASRLQPLRGGRYVVLLFRYVVLLDINRTCMSFVNLYDL